MFFVLYNFPKLRLKKMKKPEILDHTSRMIPLLQVKINKKCC